MYFKISEPSRFIPGEILRVIKNQYDFKADVSLLASDIGQNFLLKTDAGKQFIFKISNNSELLTTLEAQNAVLDFLQTKDIEFEIPRVIGNKENKKICEMNDHQGNPHNARLLSFIHGQFLADIASPSDLLLEDIGKKLGIIDQSLQTFYHPAAYRHWHWDLKNLPDIRQYTNYISNPDRKRLVEYFLLQFETEVVPQFSSLRQSLIHNDANDHNILIDPDSNECVGIIDFGDMVYSYTIFELAVALAYIMMQKKDPLKTAVPVIGGYHRQWPLKKPEIDVLYYAICARLCLSVTMSAYQQQQQPDNDYLTISEKPAWDLLETMLEINPQKAVNTFREICDLTTPAEKRFRLEFTLRERKSRIGPSLSISYQKPLHIIRGGLQYLYDDTGRTYLDCVNNVCHVGHAHPTVVRAAQKQMATLNTNTRYLHDYLIQYAKRLTDTLPKPLSVCYFVNSGSEANELALRLAYTHTKQKDIIILDNAYHGNTSALIDISPYKYEHKGGSGPGLFTHKAMMPDIYRGPFKKDDKKAGKKYAADVQGLISELRNNDKKPAAFMCESLLGCGGQIVLPDDYLPTVYPLIRENGGVCIIDEVQVGFGRVGSHFWGFELQGVVPDIITMGKPIGNGHPLGAVVCTREIAESFNNGMEYFNTFGGNPVSCATGLAVLDVIEKEELQANALRVGNRMMAGFQKLKKGHPIIGDVRGSGLFCGIELVTDPKTLEPATSLAAEIIEKMKNEGILLSTDGPFANVIKIKPPIVFSEKNADRVVETLGNVLTGIKQ